MPDLAANVNKRPLVAAVAGKLGQIPAVHQAPTDDLALQTDSPLD